MEFDASDAIHGADARRLSRELDGQRVLREVARGLAMDYDLRQQYQKVLRDINVRTAQMVRRSISAPLADLSSHMLRQTSTFAIRDLSLSVAQAFKAQGIASAYSDAWSLYRVPSFRAPTRRSVVKSTPTFGPIVVSPDDEAPPSNYHPDLQGWLIPKTGADSGDAIDVEELVAVVFAYALGIAQHHRTRVLLTVVGKHGGAFLIHVAEGTVAGLLLYWLLSR